MKHDRTFSDVSAFGSDAWCAATMGKSVEWFRKMRPTLEAIQFPPKDAITGLTIKADVEAWISRRRKLADRAIVETSDTTGGHIHHDRL
mgnify:FL=1|jgi:hypothetical protein